MSVFLFDIVNLQPITRRQTGKKVCYSFFIKIIMMGLNFDLNKYYRGSNYIHIFFIRV